MDPAGPLPPHLEPQPPLVQPLCVRCAKRWGWKNAKADEDLPGLLRRTCEEKDSCQNCELCRSRRKPCEEIDPYFHRAANLLIYLWKQYVFIVDVDQGEWEIQTAQALFRDYAVKFTAAYNERTRHVQELKQDLGETGYRQRKQRIENERHEDYARFTRGEESHGSMQPTNVVVDAGIERYLYKSMAKEHLQEFWYGPGYDLARIGW